MAAKVEPIGLRSILRKVFWVKSPAHFLKDPEIPPKAKLLRLLIAAHADGKSGETFVSRHTLQRLMRCGREVRERAQKELVAAGWLHVKREKRHGGQWGRNLYVLTEPPYGSGSTSAGFTGTGRTGSGATSSGQASHISDPQSCHVTPTESLSQIITRCRNRESDLT